MGYLAEMQRKNLETLMGAESMGDTPGDTKFTDAKVCRNFLCGTCPHDLFTNTKMDLGQCPKLHSKRLKDDYDSAVDRARKSLATGEPKASSLEVSAKELENMMREYERNIMVFVEECDRRIRAAQRRLEKTPEENNKSTNLMREIGEIESAYSGAMQAVEQLGEAGQIDESMAELAKAEALKAEKQDKERELQLLTENSGASGHQKLRVCEICGAYLSILDSDKRLADHFGGKMHLGYHTLRLTIDEWRDRGLNNVSIMNSQPKPAVPKDEDMQDGEVSHANGVNGNGDSDRRDSTKRASDLPDDSEREKRRRYD